MQTANVPNLGAPSDWMALSEAWAKFTEQHPEIGLSPSRYASSRFVKGNFPSLYKAGAVVRTSAGRYLAHRERFAPAAFALVVGVDPTKAGQR